MFKIEWNSQNITMLICHAR